MFVAASGHVAGHGVAAIGSDAEPDQRERRICLNATAIQEDLAEQGLRFQLSGCGSSQYQPCRTLGLFSEVPELFGAERLLTTQKMRHQTSTQRRSRL